MSDAESPIFTLSEANKIVERIKPLMAEVLAIREAILASQADLWPAVERSAGNGGNLAMSKLVETFGRLDALLHEIQRTGAIVKDVNTGLVDFRAVRAGREVYLCWKHGEAAIQFWHEVDAGFQGRQPIEAF